MAELLIITFKEEQHNFKNKHNHQHLRHIWNILKCKFVCTKQRSRDVCLG